MLLFWVFFIVISLIKLFVVEFVAINFDSVVFSWCSSKREILLTRSKQSKESVSVFVQLSSKGRTWLLSMVISWEFAKGPGGPVCFLWTLQPFGPSVGTQDFLYFISAGTSAVGGEKTPRKGNWGKGIYKIKQSKKKKQKKDWKDEWVRPNRLRLVRKIEPSSGVWA